MCFFIRPSIRQGIRTLRKHSLTQISFLYTQTHACIYMHKVEFSAIADLVNVLNYFLTSDGLHHDVFPQNVSCKCYFFDNLGQLSPNGESDQNRFKDVLRRRFFRQGVLSL